MSCLNVTRFGIIFKRISIKIRGIPGNDVEIVLKGISSVFNVSDVSIRKRGGV